MNSYSIWILPWFRQLHLQAEKLHFVPGKPRLVPYFLRRQWLLVLGGPSCLTKIGLLAFQVVMKTAPDWKDDYFPHKMVPFPASNVKLPGGVRFFRSYSGPVTRINESDEIQQSVCGSMTFRKLHLEIITKLLVELLEGNTSHQFSQISSKSIRLVGFFEPLFWETKLSSTHHFQWEVSICWESMEL